MLQRIAEAPEQGFGQRLIQYSLTFKPGLWFLEILSKVFQFRFQTIQELPTVDIRQSLHKSLDGFIQHQSLRGIRLVMVLIPNLH